MGIRHVTGGIAGDESAFDSMRVAPGWLASFAGNESPPLSALVVDRARTQAAAPSAIRPFAAAQPGSTGCSTPGGSQTPSGAWSRRRRVPRRP